MSSPEHELHLDLTEVHQLDRLKLVRYSQKIGGTVINDDLAPLIDNAPLEPKKKKTHTLETELSSRAPFSLIIRPNRDPKRSERYDPGYKKAVLELVELLGVTSIGATEGLKALTDRNGSPTSRQNHATALAEMQLSRHIGQGYQALTLNDPSQITAERLRKYAHSLGETGANAALTVLVEVSGIRLHLSEM